MDPPIETDHLITPIRGIIIQILMIRERYMFVMDVKSWDIMLTNILTQGNLKIMFPYARIVKRWDILQMSVPILRSITNQIIEIGRKESVFVFKKMRKGDLGMLIIFSIQSTRTHPLSLKLMQSQLVQNK